MTDPNYKFSDGTESDCIEEAQEKVSELLNDNKDFSVYISKQEIRFVNLENEDVQRNSR